MTETDPSRRNVLAGLAAAGVAAPVLAACGSSADATGTTAKSANEPISTTDIPVGGGKIFAAEEIVVTQPSAGDFKAFSAVCTHQGCTVGQVAQGAIICPCHFSVFSIEDGSVESGPAPSPLPEKTVTVSGDTLTVS